MRQIVIAIGIKNGKCATECRNIEATIEDIALSITLLEQAKLGQLQVFNRMGMKK